MLSFIIKIWKCRWSSKKWFCARTLGDNTGKLNNSSFMAPRGASGLDCKVHFSVYRYIYHCLIFNMCSVNSDIHSDKRTFTEAFCFLVMTHLCHLTQHFSVTLFPVNNFVMFALRWTVIHRCQHFFFFFFSLALFLLAPLKSEAMAQFAQVEQFTAVGWG